MNSAVNQLAELESAIIDTHEKPMGTLRLTVAGAFGELYIAPAAAEFMRRYPDITINLDFTSRVVDLVSDGYDLAIRAGVLKDSSLIARRIAERRLLVCASRDYLSRQGQPATLTDLRNQLQLTRSRQAGAGRGGIRVERVNGQSTLIDRKAEARELEKQISAVEPLVTQLSTALQEARQQYVELSRTAENLLQE